MVLDNAEPSRVTLVKQVKDAHAVCYHEIHYRSWQEVVFIFQIMIRQESPSSSFCKLQLSVKAS